jgi:hypothetical protein
MAGTPSTHALLAGLAGLVLPLPVFAGGNLVVNSGFELFSGPNSPGQIAPAISDMGLGDIGRVLNSWTKTCVEDCTGGGQGTGSQGFAFLINSAADSTGFQSVFSGPNITMWGPNSGSANGFTGSPDGGYFVGIDGSYGRSSLEQWISGLTAGEAYTLSFEYAGGQFVPETGATEQYWKVDFGSESVSAPTMQVSGMGFSGWQTAVIDFVASSTSQVLKFTAFGGVPGTGPNFGPGGLPPFLLLDGISLRPKDQPPNPSVPGPLPIFGAAAGLMVSRRLRARIRRPGHRP